ncbi:dihydropteroate synthase [Selenomonadales bacterium OttesenSCG-928-I06]|nr:dihydropteroate synthase [Selenomonadales bacterium OttesenSCG-928-I06]
MEYNARAVFINDKMRAKEELRKIGSDDHGIEIMAEKAIFKIVKLENVKSRAASILKQTFLSKGAEVAVAKSVASFSFERTDVLICATIKQYKEALPILRIQPWGLETISLEIETILNTLERYPKRNYSSQTTKSSFAIEKDKTLIMGILNVTPDSFSDGGKFNNIDSALRHAEKLITDGADILDIGAESTRPYGDCEKISVDAELERLIPTLEKIHKNFDIPISVDTYKAKVAAEALKHGALLVNDIWGLKFDPDMAKIIAEFNVPVVIMHNQEGTDYEKDILSEMLSSLRDSMKIGLQAGVGIDKFIVDPGIGFGKTTHQNLIVMSRLEELVSLGCPILLATSRKKFIGETLDLPVDERVEGTSATVALGIAKGVNIVRVHDVKEVKRITKMMDAMLYPPER